ncbi:uracil-DNA glycosylase family protein [Pseudofrankia inefficax]|uniref:Uracil-DNA glycosylase superfamily n=1 Tax=Pseudofrankia inefficax (strain DSM 45817 / CECT 9037 / DDB 130130 / EuI1c) TaxID=298654 RepID=E3J5Z2_PSEI1|nr:uracil-DNA glycosylase family protein [Pseudofrankia inefficax]ADP84373.1 Uracil-DNA glycosylase superfamily [Pseudofrankia inefficax]
MTEFDPGYGQEPYASLVAGCPGPEVNPAADFRVEWGPIFHRGRLDGTARLLVLGQDPAAHEAIARRILIGTAGRRIQGFLAKLGITHSYTMINTFVYSVYGQTGGNRHAHDPAIGAYRHRWLDALTATNPIDAVVALGTLADKAFHHWRATPTGSQYSGAYQHILHPTYPDSSTAADGDPTAAMAAMLANWNAALDVLHPAITHPDLVTPLVHYGDDLTPGDLATIPERDLPAGLPAWMRADEAWASRQGTSPVERRATIVVTIPTDLRPF